MADNFVSYNRFTALPPNIADYGATVEELRLQRGHPDANPVLSPMATPRASMRRLYLRPSGSDELRVGEPDEPEVDPYEGPRSILSLSRTALRKLQSPIIARLDEQLTRKSAPDDDTNNLMRDSLRRVANMRAALKDLTEMTEGITVRLVAASRG